MIARMTEIQKLKQKSQLNKSDISLGASSIILSLNSNLLISSIINAEAKAIFKKAKSQVIKYIVDIVLLLLK